MIITFDPIIHDKVWGTEEWLLTEENVPNNIPKDLWDYIQIGVWGGNNQNPGKVPLALKVINAREDLSFQVHPDKNELWWILESGEYRRIYAGAYTNNIQNPFIDCLEVKPIVGSTISLPRGTPHMLGGGIKVFELADCLGTTYRFYDHGRNRALQKEEAASCIKLEFPNEERKEKRPDEWLKSLPYEVAWPLKLRKYEGHLIVPDGSTFYYHYVLEGSIECEGHSFEKGQGFLVTASHRKGYVLKGQGSVLTVSFL